MTNVREKAVLKARFDGNDLRAMLTAATRLLERNIESINALNVFPVPDGDTGTNMFLTLRGVTKQAEGIRSGSAGEVAAVMARGALMEARGNSGVILSQFFKGIAAEFEGDPDFGPAELASAFRRARHHAYTAVAEPVEGTLLTVISSVAEASRASADAGGTLQEVFGAVCDAAREAVALTPTLLSVLREAGVVDAGGQGLSVILEGFRLYLDGRATEAVEMQPPEPVGVDVAGCGVSREFLQAADEESYGYCTQFLVQGRDLHPAAVREKMSSLAQSTVVVGDETLINVHVHTHDPGPILSVAVSLGTLSQVKIENMDEQRRAYSVARRQDADLESSDVGTVPVAVVSVAWGKGLERVFAELGAARVLPAGDTMNPSTQEILDAVQSAPSDNVIFLPNNRNILPAAKQAIELSKKSLRVVQTTSIPQGIAAILEFDAEKGLDDNVSCMERRRSSVRTGEICRAVRPAQLNDLSVQEGQIIGLLERDLLVAGDEPTEVLVSLLKEAGVSEGDLVTLYWGGPLTRDDAEAAYEEVRAAFPDTEVEVLNGSQPHYHFIVSIE